MFDVLSPEFHNIVVYGSVIVLTILVALLVLFVVPAYRKSEFYQRNKVALDMIGEVVTNVVMRIAFSGEDLAVFEEEAMATGRDVRLVAAIHYIDEWTTSLGYDIPEETIISFVERRLEELKQAGIIPRADAA
jgi:hypothetical protein